MMPTARPTRTEDMIVNWIAVIGWTAILVLMIS